MIITTGDILSVLFTRNSREVLGEAKISRKPGSHKVSWCDIWTDTTCYHSNDLLRVEKLV